MKKTLIKKSSKTKKFLKFGGLSRTYYAEKNKFENLKRKKTQLE